VRSVWAATSDVAPRHRAADVLLFPSLYGASASWCSSVRVGRAGQTSGVVGCEAGGDAAVATRPRSGGLRAALVELSEDQDRAKR
jgi:hypothetical protein